MRLPWWSLFAVLVPGVVLAQQCTQSQLNTEFMTDPTARTYVTCSSDGDLSNPNTTNDQCVLGKFNAPCTGNPACKVDQTVSREVVWGVVNAVELETLQRSTAANDVARVHQLSDMLHNITFDMGDADIRQKWSNIFTGPGSPITNAAILALQQKDVPRSQTVCGRPGTLSDVSLGLRGTP